MEALKLTNPQPGHRHQSNLHLLVNKRGNIFILRGYHSDGTIHV